LAHTTFFVRRVVIVQLTQIAMSFAGALLWAHLFFTVFACPPRKAMAPGRWVLGLEVKLDAMKLCGRLCIGFV